MTVLSDYIARMVAAGMDQDDAVQIIAEVFAAGAANVASKSADAKRQQRYRNRQKASQTVTKRNASVEPETVTKRNDVTESNASSLSIEKNKKERKGESRASQMPNGWRPSVQHWDSAVKALGGSDRAEKELRKFANNAAAKGLAFKKWDAAWDNWVDRAVEWAPTKTVAVSPVVEKISMEEAVEQFKRFGLWSRASPVNDISQVPVELLAKHGLLPDGRKMSAA